jgi:hypothetical protein
MTNLICRYKNFYRAMKTGRVLCVDTLTLRLPKPERNLRLHFVPHRKHTAPVTSPLLLTKFSQ